MLIPVFAVVLLTSQEKISTYGKSPAQVLEMGQKKWMDFFVSKAGSSTAAMVDGVTVYAEIAEARNAKVLLAKSPELQNRWKVLTNGLSDFGKKSISIYSPLSDGGTIWNIMFAGVKADVEDLVYGCLTRSGTKPPKMVVSKVEKDLDSLKALIEKTSLDPGVSATKQSLRDEFATMRAIYRDQILPQAKKLTRRQSDMVLSFCSKTARIGMDMAGN